MNSKELAIFLESLDVKRVTADEVFEENGSQNLLCIDLWNPLKFSIESDEGTVFFAANTIEMMSKDKTIEFILDGVEKFIVQTSDIRNIVFRDLSEDEMCEFHKEVEQKMVY